MFGNTSLFIPNPVMYSWLMMHNAWNMVTVMVSDNGQCGLVKAINSNQTGIWRLLVVQNAVVTRCRYADSTSRADMMVGFRQGVHSEPVYL